LFCAHNYQVNILLIKSTAICTSSTLMLSLADISVTVKCRSIISRTDIMTSFGITW
jgi:hypothetical protein